MTGDVKLGNYAGTELGAQMHYMSGRIESAINICEDYKLFLSENNDLAESEEEYEHYMDIAESKLIELRSKMY